MPLGSPTLALVISVALMLIVGLSLGLLGSGGSIIALPVLVYVAGIPVKQAVAMSLVVVGVTAAFGAVVQGRLRGIDRRAAIVFALTGMVGAFFGAKLTHLVAEPILLLLFGSLMITAGTRLLTRRPLATAAEHTCRVGACLLAGLTVGLLTGFLGIGGGFLIVPALLLFAGTDMKRAVPTSLSVIAANAAGGVLGQLHAASLPWGKTGVLLLAALLGTLAGSALTNRLSSAVLQRVFAWSILSLGSAIVLYNLWLIASHV